MADIDIFNLEPSKISRDLKGKFLLIYGNPKTGKSTFGSQLPRSLFLNFEQGTNALAGIRSVPILRWADAKKVLSQLRKPQAKEMYDTIVVDTVDIAWNLAEKYICQREGTQTLREIPWGAGWGMLRQEFSEFWREITLLGFGILFIAHAKEKPTDLRDEEGNPISMVMPNIGGGAATDIINGIVDIIGYLHVQMNPNGTTERYLYTRSTPTIFAGSRYQHLAPKIKFGYQELVDAIGDAIDKAVELDGAQVTDKTVFAQVKDRPFAEIMEEAKQIWVSFLERGNTEDEKEQNLNIMKDIVKQVFGNADFKISQAVPSQSDLVELFISEMKEI